jgi:osmoprotectant transport system permease protein
MHKNKYYIIILSILLLTQAQLFSQQTIRVGSKHFNEGYILSEIISQMLEDNGYKVERNFNLGGTKVCFDALKNGAIDIYPEYTGTITEEILKLDKPLSLNEVNDKLKQELNLEISEPYGFNNTYAFVVTKETADKYNLKKISDLRNHAELNIALSYEFLKRKDGWENLAAAYGLTNKAVGIEHGLAYQALDGKKIDLTDAYSTDGEIVKFNLVTLEDDKSFFPKYYAVSFYRTGLDEKAKKIISGLKSQINESQMQAMNSKVLYEKKSFAEVASEFLKSKNLIKANTETKNPGVYVEIFKKTLEHIKITLISLLLALIIAIPLGVFIYIYSSISKPVLYFAGLLQTIPSIALLAFMIPLFGIGVVPAIAALFLYALLPILRNTASGLFTVDPLLRKVATGMGLTVWQKLRYIELPLAMPAIFAGIKTAAVINIGTATLAAFIGAGGLGEFIVTGLALNNTELILRGAIPAAMLAIITEFIFDLIEKIYVPKHLQQKLEK